MCCVFNDDDDDEHLAPEDLLRTQKLPTMAFSKAEATPLIGGRRHDEGPRRRTGPQHATLPTHGHKYPSSPADAGKLDRRGVCGRLCSSVGGVCCGRPAQDPNAEYYEDDFNDQPWECTFGTSDQDGVWINYGDQVGTIMSSMVWILIIYSMVTITLLAQHNHMPNHVAMIYGTICALALASHIKTTLTDPGSIPQDAVPRAILFKQGITTHAMCSHCQTYKPPNSHHCRICNRCISRMDHHCPWMNNCVGANNFSKSETLAFF